MDFGRPQTTTRIGSEKSCVWIRWKNRRKNKHRAAVGSIRPRAPRSRGRHQAPGTGQPWEAPDPGHLRTPPGTSGHLRSPLGTSGHARSGQRIWMRKAMVRRNPISCALGAEQEYGPKMAHNGPKMPPKIAQDGPKKTPRWRKTARRKCHKEG